ncbi:GDSL-type esterase/lipase family protein [Cohnella faecalis]|uniref:GDSL family lipase n=1 Tax=Cohnella faecalis TaxID=2315694 RepID=A0A398CQF7_9BACL|nr:GDSL-type esterase/lipase family protein [Cohnella faecalis]RIE04712.1 GDSL family lipase [Cohnella faecalis]
MRSNVWLWRILGLTTLVCTIALVGGFGWALKDNWFPSSGLLISDTGQAESPTATGGAWTDKKELIVTALGDSLTVGTGDVNGEGYVRDVTDGLSKALDKPVRLLNNMAVGGLRADELAELLDEKGYRNGVGQADIVLLTIGGNDMFQIAGSGGSVAEGSDLSPELLQQRLPEAERRLASVFKKLRAINPNARIVYIGLYNPFYDLPAMRPASDIILDWNAVAHKLAEADGNATVVPTYDLFETRITDYLSSDHFHPNTFGYARIAQRVVQALH